MDKVILLAAIAFVCPAVTTKTTPPGLHLREGDVCNVGPPPSYCRYLKDCQGNKQSKRQLQVCVNNGQEPIVCCDVGRKNRETTSTTTASVTMPNKTGKSISDKMCHQYAKYVYRLEPPLIPLPFAPPRNVSYCGQPAATPLIIGGKDAKLREFPHMARIGYGHKIKTIWSCGGSLISENFVLSAAHCSQITDKVTTLYAKWVNLGDLDISTDDDKAEPVTIQIIEIINHPEYKDKMVYHDIALYKLEKKAPVGINIRPLCLNTNKDIATGQKLWASGWGHQIFDNYSSSSNILQKVKLNYVSNEECNNFYRPYTRKQEYVIPKGIDPDYMLCAGGITGKDTCQGDSGGPLQIVLNSPYCMYSIVGVVSFGVKCGSHVPGVYTNVAHYVPWIESIVWPKHM